MKMHFLKIPEPVSQQQAGQTFREFTWTLAGLLQRAAKTRSLKSGAMKPAKARRTAPRTGTGKRSGQPC